MRIKLITIFFVLVMMSLVPLGIFAFFCHRIMQVLLVDEANQVLNASASQTAASIDAFIEANLRAIDAEAQLPTLVAYLNQFIAQRTGSSQELEVRAILQGLSRKDERFILSYALLDNQGVNVADTDTTDIGRNEFEHDYFQVPLRTNQAYISPLEFSQMAGEATLYFASPVHDISGELIGVLRVRYDAAVLQDLVVQNTGLAGPQSFGVLFDENYLLLAHGLAPEIAHKLVALPEPDRVAELQAAGRLPLQPPSELSLNMPPLEKFLANADLQLFFAVEDPITGGINQAAVIMLKTQPWLVAFFQPQEVFLRSIKAQTRNMFFLVTEIASLMTLAAFGLTVLVGRIL